MYRATIAYHLMLDTFTMYSILSHSGMIITSYIVYHVGYNTVCTWLHLQLSLWASVNGCSNVGS